MTLMKKLERTGRTTRMLQDAVRQASSGKEVFVVVRSMEEVPRAMEQAYALAPEPKPSKRHTREGDRLVWENGGSAEIVPAGSLTRDELLDLHVRGTDTMAVVLLDHYVIERVFGSLLSMLHKYDPVVE